MLFIVCLFVFSLCSTAGRGIYHNRKTLVSKNGVQSQKNALLLQLFEPCRDNILHKIVKLFNGHKKAIFQICLQQLGVEASFVNPCLVGAFAKVEGQHALCTFLAHSHNEVPRQSSLAV